MAQFFIINTSRRPKTRFIRKARPSPEKFVQTLCGGKIRLPRKRHRPLPVELLEQFWDQLEAKWRGGAIEVRIGTPTGELFRFDRVTEGMVDEPEEHEEELVEEEAEEVEEAEEEAEEEEPELEPEEEIEEEPEPEPTPEEEPERPNENWVKAQICDWIIQHVDGTAVKADLMKLKKEDLLEITSS